MSQENCLPQIVHKTGPGRARAATVVARATGETYRLRMARTRPLHAPPCCVRDTDLQVARHPAILVAWSTGEIHRLAWRNSSLPEPPLRYTLRMARSTKMCGFGSDHPVEASKQFRADGGLEQTRVGRESQAVTKMSRKLRKTVAILWPMATNEGESRLREFVPTC